jgi:hypothetical protein
LTSVGNFTAGKDMLLLRMTPSKRRKSSLTKTTLSGTSRSIYRIILRLIKHGWKRQYTAGLDGVVPNDEFLEMIDHAYDVVVAKLPKYVQRELREL